MISATQKKLLVVLFWFSSTAEMPYVSFNYQQFCLVKWKSFMTSGKMELPRHVVTVLRGSFLHYFHQDPLEVMVDDDTKLTLHGLQQHYLKLKESEKSKRLFELLDLLEFNQV